jgi:hypothetical protein
VASERHPHAVAPAQAILALKRRATAVVIIRDFVWSCSGKR